MENRVIEMVRKEIPSPFNEVWTQPMTVAGQEVPQVAVMMREDDGTPRYVASHSPGYQLVANELVSQVTEDVLTRMGQRFKHVKTIWDGRKFMERFIITETDIMPVDTVFLGIDAINSYDGSTKFGVRFFMHRLVCSNGLYSSKLLGGFVFKHVMDTFDIDDALNELERGSERFMSAGRFIERMMGEKVNLDTVLDWHKKLADASPAWPLSKSGAVLNALDGTEPTVWNLLNAFTFVTTHEINPFRGPRLSDRVMELALAAVGG